MYSQKVRIRTLLGRVCSNDWFLDEQKLLIMTDKVDISIAYQIYKIHIRRVKVSRSISGLLWLVGRPPWTERWLLNYAYIALTLIGGNRTKLVGLPIIVTIMTRALQYNTRICCCKTYNLLLNIFQLYNITTLALKNLVWTWMNIV